MIIGKGDIASVLTDRDDVIYFASGVSNSKCKDTYEFDREMQLLLSQPRDIHLVYFSSLCIYYGTTEYARHKRVMEQSVKNNFGAYTIIRLGNIDWGKNPNTLINYLRSHPEASLQNTYRHVVSLDEFKYWLNFIKPGTKNEMNIPGKMWFVPDLAAAIKLNNPQLVKG